MSSFGGETPVNAVGLAGAIASGAAAVYTVPAGRYAKIVIHGAHGSIVNPFFAIGNSSLRKTLTVDTYDGSTFTANSGVILYGGGSSGNGTLRASIIEFNNP